MREKQLEEEKGEAELTCLCLFEAASEGIIAFLFLGFYDK